MPEIYLLSQNNWKRRQTVSEFMMRLSVHGKVLFVTLWLYRVFGRSMKTFQDIFYFMIFWENFVYHPKKAKKYKQEKLSERVNRTQITNYKSKSL